MFKKPGDPRDLEYGKRFAEGQVGDGSGCRKPLGLPVSMSMSAVLIKSFAMS